MTRDKKEQKNKKQKQKNKEKTLQQNIKEHCKLTNMKLEIFDSRAEIIFNELQCSKSCFFENFEDLK